MLLFVCTGNTCRSPLAAAMARALGAEAASAGLNACEGAPASEGAIRAAARRGLDLTGHRARQVTEAMMREAERVYTMTNAHAEALKSAFPAEKDKVSALSPAISDPFGGGDDVYENCAWDLEDALKICLSRSGKTP